MMETPLISALYLTWGRYLSRTKLNVTILLPQSEDKTIDKLSGLVRRTQIARVTPARDQIRGVGGLPPW
jgi:hypothetical protein